MRKMVSADIGSASAGPSSPTVVTLTTWPPLATRRTAPGMTPAFTSASRSALAFSKFAASKPSVAGSAAMVMEETAGSATGGAAGVAGASATGSAEGEQATAKARMTAEAALQSWRLAARMMSPPVDPRALLVAEWGGCRGEGRYSDRGRNQGIVTRWTERPRCPVRLSPRDRSDDQKQQYNGDQRQDGRYYREPKRKIHEIGIELIGQQNGVLEAPGNRREYVA